MANHARSYSSLSDSERRYDTLEKFYRTTEKDTTLSGPIDFSLAPFFNSIKNRMKESGSNIETDWAALQQKVEKSSDDLKNLVPLLFPSLCAQGEMGFISLPFTNIFNYVTPTLSQYYQNKDWELEITDMAPEHENNRLKQQATLLILERCYGIQRSKTFHEIICLRHKPTGLEKYLRITPLNDFVAVRPLVPLREISQVELEKIREHCQNDSNAPEGIDLVDFSFEGFTMGKVANVTRREVLASLESFMATDESQVEFDYGLKYIQRHLRSYLNMPDVGFGSVYTKNSMWQESTDWMLLRTFDPKILHPAFEDPNSIYGGVLHSKKEAIWPDLGALVHPNALETELLKQGYKSLMVIPIFEPDGAVLGLAEIASRTKGRLNRGVYAVIKDFISVFSMGMNSFIVEIENQVGLVIRDRFTAIQQSVEWKFRKVATEYYWAKTSGYEAMEMRPVIFENLFPLYGQFDIIDSSEIRNQCIKQDLNETLKATLNLIDSCVKKTYSNSLAAGREKVLDLMDNLEASDFTANDESLVRRVVHQNILPLINSLQSNSEHFPVNEYKSFLERLDEQLGIFYEKRKEYEKSVSHINSLISNTLEKENKDLQLILPHFFDSVKTDGVAFNMYLGESILQHGNFNRSFVQEFQKQQLRSMCTLTRYLCRSNDELAISLHTAQLILAYDETLNIRFRMDEKRFDIDGAYDVRYEILKKRIDKAVVEGSQERLSKKGKLAIVYIDASSKTEYIKFLAELKKEQLIAANIEDLALAPMKGLYGLRALRISIKM